MSSPWLASPALRRAGNNNNNHHQNHHQQQQQQQQPIQRTPFNSTLYRKQDGRMKANGRHHPSKAFSCNNNNDNDDDYDMTNNDDDYDDDNNNNNNVHSNANDNSSDTNNAAGHGKANSSKRSGEPQDVTRREDNGAQSNSMYHGADETSLAVNHSTLPTPPPPPPLPASGVDSSCLLLSESKTPTCLVGKNFAGVMASGKMAADDDDDDVDDGFEDGTSGSPVVSNNCNIDDNNNNNNCNINNNSNCGTFAESTRAAGSICGEDARADKIPTSPGKKTPAVIKDIPERFKKLLKAAADKATAQRLRVEGAPLVRGQADAATRNLVMPQQTIGGGLPFVPLPSYPAVAVGLPQPPPLYCQPAAFYEAPADLGASSSQKAFVPEFVAYGYDAGYDASHGQAADCCAADFNYGPQLPKSAAAVAYPSALPYGHLAYHPAAVAGHHYAAAAPALVADSTCGFYYCSPSGFYDCSGA